MYLLLFLIHYDYYLCTVDELAWCRQSQVVQRGLPHPTDVNTSILRGAPHKDQKYRELYQVLFFVCKNFMYYSFCRCLYVWGDTYDISIT